MKTKKSFYLHLGMHKNASKFLQTYIFEKNKLGIPKCRVFTGESGVKIFVNLIEKVLRNKISIHKAKNLIKEYTKNYQNIIISQESLLGYHFDNFEDVEKKFIILEKLFNKPNYLIVYRDQAEFLFSLWTHKIRLGLKNDFKKFINCQDHNYNKGKRSIKYLTDYKIYNYNKIFRPYIPLANKRAIFLNFERIKNKPFFINKMKKFFSRKILKDKFDINHKVNVSRKFELIYFFCYKNFKIINSIVLNILRLVYFTLRLFNLIEVSNYKQSHFNKISFIYFNMIKFIFFNKSNSSGVSFLKNLEKERLIVKNYFKKQNLKFQKITE